MSEIFSHQEYWRDPSLALSTLGALLSSSAFCLFLGAGVSTGFGLPGWKGLIARILKKDTDLEFVEELDRRSVKDLPLLLDEIDDGSLGYLERVHEALYRDASADLSDQLMRSPLLLAVAALMAGAHRGRIATVITYNYDDLLEQYLRMLGLSVCSRLRPDVLSTRADVELNYVHGYLPQHWDAPKFTADALVLSNASYIKRAAINSGWSASTENLLHSKLGLFLGLSGDDDSMLVTLTKVKNQIARSQDYIGYWILTPDAFARNKNRILRTGACPIPVDKDEIPKYLFKVCQAATA